MQCEEKRWNLTAPSVSAAGITDDRRTVGEAWFDAVDQILNVTSYENTYFEIPRRLAEAAEWCAAASRAPNDIPALWLQRVRTWAANLKRDLRDDGVPKPGSLLACSGDARERWMLYIPDLAKAATSDTSVVQASELLCHLCHDCKSALGAPVPRMPWKARARGMWRGPTSDELQVLTFAERQVIQLARLHIQVRKVEGLSGKAFQSTPATLPYSLGSLFKVREE